MIIVYKPDEQGNLAVAYLLTLVHVVDGNKHEMRMVNRDSKTRKPDWPLTQVWFDKLRQVDPASNKQGARWEVTLKSK